MGYKLVLFTNRKSHTDFLLVPKSVTVNGPMAVITYNFTQYSGFQSQLSDH